MGHCFSPPASINFLSPYSLSLYFSPYSLSLYFSPYSLSLSLSQLGKMAWKYTIGLLSVLLLVIIYVSSAEISQSVFRSYRHPFVMVYVGTSMLILYLPITFIKKWIKRHLRNRIHKKSNKQVANGSSTEVQTSEEDNKKPTKDCNDNEQQESSTDDQCAIDIDPLEKEKKLVLKREGEGDTPKEERKLDTKEVAILAVCLGPIWFISEYFTSCALARTSVASTTILFSTSGLFTLVIDACLKRSINLVNVVSVVISMAGVAMTTTGKTWAADTPTLNQKHSFSGDAFALLAAMTDGLYFVLLKKYAGENGQRLELEKFLGFAGLFVFSSLWWLVWPLTALGIEPKFALPKSVKVVEVIVANCFLGNFVADYFWALGAMWTSPLVAALGSSLTIPLAMLTDMVVHGRHYSLLYILGSIQVFVGFIVANISDWLTPKLRLMFSKFQK